MEYLEKYMYFDKEGIIVEASNEKTQGIPLVTGLSFEHVVLYEPLPVRFVPSKDTSAIELAVRAKSPKIRTRKRPSVKMRGGGEINSLEI